MSRIWLFPTIEMERFSSASELGRFIAAQCRSAGVKESAVSQAVAGYDGVISDMKRGRWPGFDRVQRIANELGLELYLGPKRDVGPPDPIHPLPGDARIGEEEYSVIFLRDVNVSAGGGLIPTAEDVVASFAFPRSWLIRHGIHADLSGLVRVRGDSMAPTLPDGALILVNCAEMHVEREAIYAYSRGGEAFVKRLKPLVRRQDGRFDALVVVSDNPAYPPYTIAGADLAEVRVVGRARACISAMGLEKDEAQ